MIKKRKLRELLCNIENLKDTGGYAQSLETKISSFAMHVSVSNKYTISDEMHIAFDSGIIGAEAIIDNKGRWRLGNTCTVFIRNTEDFVDNYKW